MVGTIISLTAKLVLTLLVLCFAGFVCSSVDGAQPEIQGSHKSLLPETASRQGRKRVDYRHMLSLIANNNE